jgi:hypothetical protein
LLIPSGITPGLRSSPPSSLPSSCSDGSASELSSPMKIVSVGKGWLSISPIDAAKDVSAAIPMRKNGMFAFLARRCMIRACCITSRGGRARNMVTSASCHRIRHDFVLEMKSPERKDNSVKLSGSPVTVRENKVPQATEKASFASGAARITRHGWHGVISPAANPGG